MDYAAREGDRKIPSARVPGEHGGPGGAPVPGIPKEFAGRRASAHSFRTLTAKLRRNPAPAEVSPVSETPAAAATATAALAPAPALNPQPEIESTPQPHPGSRSEPAGRERFDMGWTSRAISPSNPSRRRLSDHSSPLDEFSDLPPEFLTETGRVEARALNGSETGQKTSPSVPATTPPPARPGNYGFWEQTSGPASTAEGAAGAGSPRQPESLFRGEPGPASSAAAAAAPSPVALQAEPSKEPRGDPERLAKRRRRPGGGQGVVAARDHFPFKRYHAAARACSGRGRPA